MIQSKCRSCGAPIIWAVTAKNKRIPIDPESREDGNIELEEANKKHLSPLAIYISEEQGGLFTNPRYVSHFATCPQSDKWRKK